MVLSDQIRISLKAEDNEANRRKWIAYFIENNVDLRSLLGLLDEDRFTTMRFLWMMGGLVEIDPKRIFPVIPFFFAKRHEVKVPHYNRSLARFFWRSGVPEEIEAEAIDALFQWVLDPKSDTTTKTLTVLAIHKLTEKYPDLKNELKLVIEDQLDKNGKSFAQRAGKILKELKMEN